MNRTYRLVWNASRRAFLPIPEFARSWGKAATVRSFGATALLATLSCVAYALPTGGQISVGQGGIAANGSAVTVTQRSQNLAINWQSFGIGASESVTFAQPSASAIALNRVLGADPSQIYGKLSANGQVWLLNPNGVLFGGGAQVNVGGLVASTLNISDADFLAGKRTFNGTGGSVVNQGNITVAAGGYVAMLGGKVSNEGVIQARLGTVALGAGSQVRLDFAGDKLLSLQVDQGAVDALVQNKQLIQADGGTVLLSARAADALVGTVVNHAGIIEAHTIDSRGGTIRLIGGSEGGMVNVSGTLDASAPGGGNGGVIETSGSQVKVAAGAVITTAAPLGNAGTWLVDPKDFTIAASGGDISGTTLARQLNTTNVTILSSNGAAPGIGDINVNAPVAWNSAHGLTLSALHSVNVNQPISNNGRGGVALRADNGGACVAGASNCGTVTFADPGHITLKGGALDIYYNPAGSNNAADANGKGPSYGTPTDYSGNVSLKGGSTLTAWMLVNDVNQLQAISTNLGGDYALGKDIAAAATSGWNPSAMPATPNAGFISIGSAPTPFSGVFDGLGHTVADLKIAENDPPDPNFAAGAGLFANSSGTVMNVGLVNIDVAGFRRNRETGALVGFNTGVVRNAYASGNVNSSSGAGGLVGFNGGTITNSYANVQVYGLVGAGGLADWNAGTVTASHASGSVNSQEDGALSGGLVGYNTGIITDAYASGPVIAYNTAGGLVGRNLGTIANANAAGNVRGYKGPVGGLVGDNSGTIQDAHATGDVTGARHGNGGLVGVNSGMLTRVYATGAVIGHSFGGGLSDSGGGLVAYNSGSIVDAYATGAVTEAYSNGGLVADNAGTIRHANATGVVSGMYSEDGGLVAHNRGLIADSSSSSNVTGGSNVGGFVGYNDVGAVIVDSHSTGTVSGTGSNVGGLVGWGQGTILNSYATGDISGNRDVGGLVGVMAGGTINGSHATGRVQGRASGGLVGGNAADIVDSYATGNVSGDAGSGGLVGFNGGNIIRSYATGDVSTAALGGGLVGSNSGSVSASHATGNVSGGDAIGGLIGSNDGPVSDSYATGTVASRGGNPAGVGHGDEVGGLIGINDGNVTRSYATGNVSSLYGRYVGGLIGLTAVRQELGGGVVSNSYATGSVRGVDSVGGLIGNNTDGSIVTSYSTGAVSGGSNVGGLVGSISGLGTVSNSYWDITTSGQTTSAGGTGLTDRQMKQRASFDGFDFHDIWRIDQGDGYPQLRAISPSSNPGSDHHDNPGHDDHSPGNI